MDNSTFKICTEKISVATTVGLGMDTTEAELYCILDQQQQIGMDLV